MAAPPPVGYVRVSSIDPPLSVTCRLSDQRPNVDSGYGGWAEVARPRRAPITTYQGAPGLHLTLPLMLDRFASGLSVETQIAQLARMGQPTGADGEPPRVRVVARGGAVPYQGRTWVINDIAYGDAEMNAAGNRTRQQLTLSLIEYVADVLVQEKSAANRQRQQAAAKKKNRGASKKRITVAAKAKKPKTAGPHLLAAGDSDTFASGESLSAIAARELGDATRWPEIAELNGLRDPENVTAGQLLRLP